MCTSTSLKIKLNIEWLYEPWSAFVHTQKKYRIYFVNSKNGDSLWAEEFFKTERVPESVLSADFVGEYAGKNFLDGLTRNDGEQRAIFRKKKDDMENQESMDTSCPGEDPLCSPKAVKNLEVSSDSSNGYFIAIAVFDTSSLIDYYHMVQYFLENRVACVIPHTVLKELDGLTKSKECSRKRAILVNSELSRLASINTEGLTFESYIDSEASLYIRAYNGEKIKFVGEVNDDKILKAALSIHHRVRRTGGQTSNVFLITEDKNLTSKGISHGLSVNNAQSFVYLVRSNVQSNSNSLSDAIPALTMKTNASHSSAMNSSMNYETSVNQVLESLNDVEMKDRKPERHQLLQSFSNETEKFLFLFKTAVDATTESVKSTAMNSESQKNTLGKLSELCKKFFDKNLEYVTFSAIITIVESLYCRFVAPLSSRERVVRESLIREVFVAGTESPVLESMKSYQVYFGTLSFE